MREESPFATENLHGLGLAAGLAQSCSFAVQKLLQQRWLAQRGASALESPAPFHTGLHTAVKAGRDLSLSSLGLQDRSALLLVLQIPLGPPCHLASVQ